MAVLSFNCQHDEQGVLLGNGAQSHQAKKQKKNSPMSIHSKFFLFSRLKLYDQFWKVVAAQNPKQKTMI